MALWIQPWLPADIWQANNHEHKPKSHYERSWSDIIEKWLSTPIWTIVFDSEKRVAIILASADTWNQLNSLRSELEWKEKIDFIEKLKQLPDYKWSKVESAVERWTIEVKKIPNRNCYAIYEGKTWNLIYLTYLDWRNYLNVDKYRYIEMLSDFFLWWYIRIWYWKIELDKKTWLWRLYKKDWKEVPIFSDEYATATLNATNEMFDFMDWIREEARKRWIKEKD